MSKHKSEIVNLKILRSTVLGYNFHNLSQYVRRRVIGLKEAGDQVEISLVV